MISHHSRVSYSALSDLNTSRRWIKITESTATDNMNNRSDTDTDDQLVFWLHRYTAGPINGPIGNFSYRAEQEQHMVDSLGSSTRWDLVCEQEVCQVRSREGV